jgi:cobalt-zinc-cadmium efflux system outer membrane protein
MNNRIALLVPALAFVLTGCTIHPAGEREERQSATAAGKPYEKQIAPLPDNASPDDLVGYAFQSSADLENKYWQWRSAIEQIPQDGTQTATINLSAGTAITNGHTSWSSSTAGLSNDPMTDIKWPSKLDAAAKAALENAKAAGWRFTKTKYELRAKVLGAYYDYLLTAHLIQLEQQNLLLLESTTTATESRIDVGSASQQEVLRAQNEVDMSRNEVERLRSQLRAQAAVLNDVLNRPPGTAVPTPQELPPIHPLLNNDEQILTAAINRNPELAALANELRARQENIRLAKLQYIPDFNISASTDLAGVTQSLLGQATIPLFRYEALNAGIAQAEANFKGSQAMRRQTSSDVAANIVADLSNLHDQDRQVKLFHDTLIPRLTQIVNITRSSYEAGQTSLSDLLEAERSLLALQRAADELQFTRAKGLAEIESLAIQQLS